MSVQTLTINVTLTCPEGGTATAVYTILQGCSDFPGQALNRLTGTLAIPSGDVAAVADLIAAAKAAAGVS